MHCFSYTSLDSTSTKAAELSKTCAESFCVSARMQTFGRGRRGRSWQSPQGGLYISFYMRQCEVKQSIPLKVSLMMCEWLFAELGVVATIKWPNDLLVGGAKLAGILCEGVSQGGGVMDLIVGIGMNVSPTGKSDATYAPIALEEVVEKKLDVDELSASLRAYWVAQWDAQIRRDSFHASYQSYWRARSRYWLSSCEQNNQIYRAIEIDHSGSLLLSPLQTEQREKDVRLRSATHEFRNLYRFESAEKNKVPLVVAIVENHRLAFRVYEGRSSSKKVIHSGVLSRPLARGWQSDILDEAGVVLNCGPIPLFFIDGSGEVNRCDGDLSEHCFSFVPLEGRSLYRDDVFEGSSRGMAQLRALLFDAWLGSEKRPLPLRKESAYLLTFLPHILRLELLSRQGVPVDSWNLESGASFSHQIAKGKKYFERSTTIQCSGIPLIAASELIEPADKSNIDGLKTFSIFDSAWRILMGSYL